MNKIVLCGNITKKPEMVQGQQLCKLNIAVKNNYKNQNGEYESEFFTLSVWGKMAENCFNFLDKGSKVLATGELHNRVYEKDGVKKYTYEIVVREIEFLSSKTKEKQEEVAKEEISDENWIL